LVIVIVNRKVAIAAVKQVFIRVVLCCCSGRFVDRRASSELGKPRFGAGSLNGCVLDRAPFFSCQCFMACRTDCLPGAGDAYTAWRILPGVSSDLDRRFVKKRILGRSGLRPADGTAGTGGHPEGRLQPTRRRGGPFWAPA